MFYNIHIVLSVGLKSSKSPSFEKTVLHSIDLIHIFNFIFFFSKTFFSQSKKMIQGEDAKDAFSGLNVMKACDA